MKTEGKNLVNPGERTCHPQQKSEGKAWSVACCNPGLGTSMEGDWFELAAEDSRRDEDEINPKPDTSSMWSEESELKQNWWLKIKQMSRERS